MLKCEKYEKMLHLIIIIWFPYRKDKGETGRDVNSISTYWKNFQLPQFTVAVRD